MKKLLAIVMVLSLLTVMFVGCSSNSNSDSVAGNSVSQSGTDSQEDSQDTGIDDEDYMKSVVDSLAESLVISGPSELDESLAQDMVGLNMDNVDKLYGVFSMMNVKSDAIIMVKAKEGAADDVKADLEAYRAAKEESCAMYLVSEEEKAKHGQIYTKGDYVLLVIAGDSDRYANGEGADVAAEIGKQVDDLLK